MIKKIGLIVLLSFSFSLFAQVNNSSPYSYFGIGDNALQTTMSASAMGGIGTAFSSGSEMNFLNPAGQSGLKLTTFNIAGNSKFLEVSDNNASQETNITTLSYIAIGFPITKKGGLVIGLQPNSNIGYNVQEEILDGNNETTQINHYTGDGGSNRLFASFGYEVIDNLSFGIEGEYLFGKIENSKISLIQDVTYHTKHSYISNLKGFSVKLGTQYKKEVKGLTVNAGAFVKLQNKINTDSDEYMYSFSYGANNIEIPRHILIEENDITGSITRPVQWSIGTGIGKPNIWYAGLNYTTQDAFSFENIININSDRVQYKPTSAINLGGYWTPKANSLTNYWKRVTYRTGFKYNDTGLAIKPRNSSADYTTINDFGMSFGLGLPIGNQMSKLNIGFEYGNRGSVDNGLVKENYYNLRLSLNLVDKWFKKNKIY